jgi:hypothetical protein
MNRGAALFTHKAENGENSAIVSSVPAFVVLEIVVCFDKMPSLSV